MRKIDKKTSKYSLTSAFVAQWIARVTSNHEVVGSSPTEGIFLLIIST